MQNQITLADGSAYDVLHCGADAGMLFITMDGELPVLDAARAFADPAATESIEYSARGDTHTFAGYTQLFGVMIERNTRKTQVFLRREG